jgi:HlyD family secretion protein
MGRRRSSYKARRVRRRRARITFLILFPLVVVFAYGAIRYVISRVLTRVEVAEFGRLEQSIMVQAVVMRDETLILSPIPGELRKMCKEGEVVKADSVVVKVINPDIEQQLEPLRSAIVFQIEQNTLKRDLSVQAIADELSSLKVQIVAARDNENVRLLSELELKKAELEEELRMTDADFEGIRTALSERLVGLEELSQVGMYSYTTREGCLVSYRLDGYEYFLSPSNLGLINVEDLQSIADRVFTVDDGMDVAIGQPVVRIVNRFRMCIGFVVSGETLSLFDDVTTISLRFGKHSRETHNATVMKVLTSIQKDAAMIVCELASYVDELTDDRIIPAEIIFQGHSGIILPEKAVIQVRGKEHVYVVSDGAHVAVPVKVKGRIDGRVAVEGVMEGARVIVNP